MSGKAFSQHLDKQRRTELIVLDHQAILDEEFEVLESIYPDELEKLADDSLRIRVEPDEPSASHPLKLYLKFTYPPDYPDVLPGMAFESMDSDENEDDGEEEETGELREGEEEVLLEELRKAGEESLGMAMTFTLASLARELLQNTVTTRLRLEKEEDDRKTREYEEAEAMRTRGTPLTAEGYLKWRKAFLEEMKAKRAKEEEERVKAMPPKEREEYRRKKERLTGRQLFETRPALADSDEALYEEGAASVDMSQYTREAREAERRREEEEAEKQRRGILGGDSDGE